MMSLKDISIFLIPNFPVLPFSPGEENHSEVNRGWMKRNTQSSAKTAAPSLVSRLHLRWLLGDIPRSLRFGRNTLPTQDSSGGGGHFATPEHIKVVVGVGTSECSLDSPRWKRFT